mmetsp:Transcript_10613/g.29323  ORF Transcript_10613/g.29323 Transcript_10613/m.29323 type:complete len:275 (+) Transcript_10613:1537-2361(+)
MTRPNGRVRRQLLGGHALLVIDPDTGRTPLHLKVVIRHGRHAVALGAFDLPHLIPLGVKRVLIEKLTKALDLPRHDLVLRLGGSVRKEALRRQGVGRVRVLLENVHTFTRDPSCNFGRQTEPHDGLVDVRALEERLVCIAGTHQPLKLIGGLSRRGVAAPSQYLIHRDTREVNVLQSPEGAQQFRVASQPLLRVRRALEKRRKERVSERHAIERQSRQNVARVGRILPVVATANRGRRGRVGLAPVHLLFEGLLLHERPPSAVRPRGVQQSVFL